MGMKPISLRETLKLWANQYDWTTLTNIFWLVLGIAETAAICWLWYEFWAKLLA